MLLDEEDLGEEELHRLHLEAALPAPAVVLAGHLVAGVADDALAELERPYGSVLGLLPALRPAAGDLLLPFLVDAGAARAVLRVPHRHVLDEVARVGVVHDVLDFHRERDLVHGGRARRVGGDQGVVLIGGRRGHAVDFGLGGAPESERSRRRECRDASTNCCLHVVLLPAPSITFGSPEWTPGIARPSFGRCSFTRRGGRAVSQCSHVPGTGADGRVRRIRGPDTATAPPARPSGVRKSARATPGAVLISAGHYAANMAFSRRSHSSSSTISKRTILSCMAGTNSAQPFLEACSVQRSKIDRL